MMNRTEYEKHLGTVRKGDCDCLACHLWFREDGFVCHGCAAQVAADYERTRPGETLKTVAGNLCWRTIERVLVQDNYATRRGGKIGGSQQ